MDPAAATALYGPQKRVTVHNERKIKKDQNTSARDVGMPNEISRSNSLNKSKNKEGGNNTRFQQFTNLPPGVNKQHMNPFATEIDKLLESKSSSQSHSNAKDPIY